MTGHYIVIPKNKYSHIVYFTTDYLTTKEFDIDGMDTWLKETMKTDDTISYHWRRCYISYNQKVSYKDYIQGTYDYIQGTHTWNVMQRKYSEESPHKFGYQFGFLNKEDALLFKLTWG